MSLGLSFTNQWASNPEPYQKKGEPGLFIGLLKLSFLSAWIPDRRFVVHDGTEVVGQSQVIVDRIGILPKVLANSVWNGR